MTKFFLDRPILGNLVTIFIFIAGILSAFNLKRATYPNVNFDIVKITTTYPGASAEDVEVNVTNKIENQLKEVSGIDRIRSVSLENLSLVYVFLDLNIHDLSVVKDDVKRAIDRVNDFPEEVRVRPLIDEIRSTNVAIIEIAIVGEDALESEMRILAQDLEDHIKEISGVASVEKLGHRKREVQIRASAELMKKTYVSLLDIYETIKNRNIHTSGGSIATFRDSKKIVTFAEFIDPEDVGEVIIRSNFSGKQIKVKEISKIEVGHKDHQVIVRTKMKRSINLLVRAGPNSDIIDMSKEIRRIMEKFRPGINGGMKLEVVSDFSYYTASLLGIVKNNAVLGMLLVLICLMIFLSRMIAFWTAVGIPFSILGTMMFFPLFDISINFISMISMILVLGLIVDDAIVVAENITNKMDKGLGRIEAALEGASEMFWPVFTTIVTTIFAFIPMFFMSGVTGRFITQIPIIVILTLVVSLFESTVILPTHIAHGPQSVPRKLLWFEKFKDFYGKVVGVAIKYKKGTLSLFIGILTIAIFLLFFKLKLILFPYDDVDLFYVIAELPEGTNIEITSEKMREVEAQVLELSTDEVINFTTYIGHHDTNVYGANSGLHENWAMISIYLKHSSERVRGSDKIILELDKKLNKLEGFSKLNVETFNDGPPVGKSITISLVSKNDELRKIWAQKVFEFTRDQPGVKGLDMDEKKGKKELRIKPDYEKMARLGITSFQLAQTLRAAFQGLVPTSITRNGEEIDFRIRLDSKERGDQVLENLQIQNSRGELINLSSFSRMEEKSGFDTIRHYNGRRSITITGDVDEKIISSKEINKRVQKEFLELIQNIPGIQIIFGGEEKETQESLRSFSIAFFCAIIGIYFILVILFSSVFQPFIILSIIPFGLSGVIFVFYLFGLPISFLGMIGCLGLLGIIVNDGLIMVAHLNKLRSSNGGLNTELILQGSKDRLRAVLLTTVTTVAGMIPTIFGFGGSEPFIIPIVLALAGGILFGTIITLILVPILYSL